MHLPAHNLAAHTSLLLLLLVVLLELRTPISVGEGTWSHANNTFQKPLRRIRMGEHRLADICTFLESAGLCAGHLPSHASALCVWSVRWPWCSCPCPAVVVVLGIGASLRLWPELWIPYVPRSCQSVFHSSCGFFFVLAALLCSGPLPPPFSHTDAPSPSPTITPLCSCSAPALLAIPSPLFPVPFSLHGGAGIFLCPLAKDCLLSRGSSWLHFQVPGFQAQA